MREKWNTLFKKLLYTGLLPYRKKNKVKWSPYSLLNYTFLQILSYYIHLLLTYLYRNFEPRLKVRNFLAPFELGGVMDLPLKNNKKKFFCFKMEKWNWKWNGEWNIKKLWNWFILLLHEFFGLDFFAIFFLTCFVALNVVVHVTEKTSDVPLQISINFYKIYNWPN